MAKLTKTVPKAPMSKSMIVKALDLDKKVEGKNHDNNLIDLPLLHKQHKTVGLLEDGDGLVQFLPHFKHAHSLLSTSIFLSEFSNFLLNIFGEGLFEVRFTKK